jgi:hypothetical protein
MQAMFRLVMDFLLTIGSNGLTILRPVLFSTSPFLARFMWFIVAPL